MFSSILCFLILFLHGEPLASAAVLPVCFVPGLLPSVGSLSPRCLGDAICALDPTLETGAWQGMAAQRRARGGVVTEGGMLQESSAQDGWSKVYILSRA